MIRLFLSGDVMTGRGIDQVMPHASDPRLHEPWVRDARQYVDLAEERNGPIPSPVDYSYIWGVARQELDDRAADARIINLETSVTVSDDHWLAKGIHYRMHPENIPCLTAARIDCCVLANNHVLDWGHAGLDETLDTLDTAGLRHAGAGHTAAAAAEPAVIDLGSGGRVLVFAFGDRSSGIPDSWRARRDRSGVNLIDQVSARSAREVASAIAGERGAGDVVVVSIHWGGNWGYAVPRAHREFAHELIDSGVVDVVHGHSSHHPKGIEIYQDRAIFYGCGDLINDYEGISGYEEYRGDLSFLYFVDIDETAGRCMGVELVPLRLERFRLCHASRADAAWLTAMLDREGEVLSTRARLNEDKSMTLLW